MKFTQDDQQIDLSTAAKLLGVSQPTVYKYRREGLLEVLRYTNGRVVYSKEQVLALNKRLTDEVLLRRDALKNTCINGGVGDLNTVEELWAWVSQPRTLDELRKQVTCGRIRLYPHGGFYVSKEAA